MDWKITKRAAFIIVAIFAIATLSIVTYLDLYWWFLGTLSEYKNWYRHFGLLLWAIKSVILVATLLICLSSLVFITKQLYNNIQHFISTAIFAAIILLGFTLNVHPFSSFPMYTSFPNWSYVFILEDLDGNVLPLKEYTYYSASDIPDLYYNYMHQHTIAYGGIESVETAQKAGKIIGENILFKKNVNGFRLVRLYYKTDKQNIIEFKTVLYEKHY